MKKVLCWFCASLSVENTPGGEYYCEFSGYPMSEEESRTEPIECRQFELDESLKYPTEP